MAEELARIYSLHDKEAKTEGYSTILYNSFVSKDISTLKMIFDHFVQEGQDVSVIKPLISIVIEALQEQEINVNEELSLYLINAFNKQNSFEGEEALVRENLADSYIKLNDFQSAALQLKQIRVDSSHRHVADEEKLRIWLKTARCYLEYEEGTDAEIFTNRASQLINSSNSPQISLQFRECFSRLMDFKRKFIEAARNYFSLACDSLLDEKDRQKYLFNSCCCAILAKAGIQRSRIISTLCKDERSKEYPFYNVLQAMNSERLVGKSNIQDFVDSLKIHQKALLADGSTVLDEALMLHNLYAARKLYYNISINELSSLLEISPQKAERAAANLIEEKRIEGYIDQVEHTIFFANNIESIIHWDQNIQTACSSLNDVLEIIVSRHPELVEQ